VANSIVYPSQSTAEFVACLGELAILIDRYAIERFRPDPTNPLDVIRFRQLVHEGWRKGQDRAAALVRALTDELESLGRTIKNANRRGDRKRGHELTEVAKLLETRRNQARHAVNAIAWTIFGNHHHVARRFFLSQSTENLSQANLFGALAAADEVNLDPNKFAVVCDLTTFMHVGDLLVVDTANEQQPFTLIELKSGRSNDRCRAVLDQFEQTGCARNFGYGLERLSDAEVDQLKRMVRQDQRAAQTIEVLNTERGTDISTGKPLVIYPQKFLIESFAEEIVRMADELHRGGRTWALGNASDCLYLGLYSDLRLAREGFRAWVAELKVDGLTIDYKSVFATKLARPTLTLELPHELKAKLFTGQWRLMMCLDVATWIDQINSIYPGGAELESKRASARLRNEGAHGLFFHHDRAVRLNFVGGELHLADGVLSKIFFDFYDPVDAVRPYFATQGNLPNSRPEADRNGKLIVTQASRQQT
jgi:hypothetical protein